MQAWLDLLKKVRNQGEFRNDRTGVGTLSLFGEAFTVDNRNFFPAVTTKELKFEQVKAELACFLLGLENIRDFHKMGCKIWDGNSSAPYWSPREPGDVGRIYGVQWRRWQGVSRDGLVFFTDQLKALVQGLVENPTSRRHIVTSYNPAEIDQMCLPPCHLMFQCYVAESDVGVPRIDLLVYMRSVDLFLGLPFDIASYALLQHLLARETGLQTGFLTFFLGDAHIYANHFNQVEEALSREPMDPPYLLLTPNASLFDFEPSQAILKNYKHRGFIAAPLNV